MKRAPYQILVIPFILTDEGFLKYCVLKRILSTGGYWQFVAGGGEVGETPSKTALRELSEEIGYKGKGELIELDSSSMIPVKNIGDYDWGEDIKEIPEYCFGIKLKTTNIVLSEEHTKYKWLSYNEALSLLKFESNKKALKELNENLTNR